MIHSESLFYHQATSSSQEPCSRFYKLKTKYILSLQVLNQYREVGGKSCPIINSQNHCLISGRTHKIEVYWHLVRVLFEKKKHQNHIALNV